MTYRDGPFDEVCREVERLVKEGHSLRQVYTCDGCKDRVVLDVPNQMFEQSKCRHCGYITDIRDKGCNYRGMVAVETK